jgi:hypothetical protein
MDSNSNKFYGIRTKYKESHLSRRKCKVNCKILLKTVVENEEIF